jgi:uncharacterized membrane protein YhdT
MRSLPKVLLGYVLSMVGLILMIYVPALTWCGQLGLPMWSGFPCVVLGFLVLWLGMRTMDRS